MIFGNNEASKKLSNTINNLLQSSNDTFINFMDHFFTYNEQKTFASNETSTLLNIYIYIKKKQIKLCVYCFK